MDRTRSDTSPPGSAPRSRRGTPPENAPKEAWESSSRGAEDELQALDHRLCAGPPPKAIIGSLGAQVLVGRSSAPVAQRKAHIEAVVLHLERHHQAADEDQHRLRP